MVLKATYWIPHGDELIDLPNENSRVMAKKIAGSVGRDNSEVRVVISPHGLGLSRNIGVIMTENFAGSFGIATRTIRGKYRNDRILGGIIADSNPGIVERVTFATGSGPKSTFPVDFGTLIPLQFFPKGDLVMIGQPRFNRREELVEFGRSLFKILDEYDRQVSMVFSADMAHTHAVDGPYGYSTDAKVYDDAVQDMFRLNNFSRSIEIPESIIIEARPDSYWNLLIMLGFLQAGGIRMNMEYYYVEHYFGMLFAHS
ncbi:MAG: DODA-type extradiol aromatic ring-opening family dioxygenase [Thermoplasmataceae archaeon]